MVIYDTRRAKSIHHIQNSPIISTNLNYFQLLYGAFLITWKDPIQKFCNRKPESSYNFI